MEREHPSLCKDHQSSPQTSLLLTIIRRPLPSLSLDRTGNAIKNHWNGKMKKRIERYLGLTTKPKSGIYDFYGDLEGVLSEFLLIFGPCTLHAT